MSRQYFADVLTETFNTDYATITATAATVLIPIEFRELVAVSSVIVHGRVTDAHGEWTDGRRSVETLVTINAPPSFEATIPWT